MTDQNGAPGAHQPAPPRGLLRLLLGLPVHLYHAGLGFLFGRRFLFLVTKGRRTGRRRETVVEVVRYDKLDPRGGRPRGLGREDGLAQ